MSLWPTRNQTFQSLCSWWNERVPDCLVYRGWPFHTYGSYVYISHWLHRKWMNCNIGELAHEWQKSSAATDNKQQPKYPLAIWIWGLKKIKQYPSGTMYPNGNTRKKWEQLSKQIWVWHRANTYSKSRNALIR